ncbi:hypothetical protein ANCCEY_03553 [Ancylostoma ceylanicum]|uniref:Uncharacterized protein n=1 Tax=Ancylostoma ceylanicum TaxID=53326 RepID=A0A0D6LZE1_9BILA|nr:hypothetical protein ANCCEY_03553 [Ancylostoma ceylanicum]
MDVDTTLERLNVFDPKVSVTIERPNADGYLPFLNTKVRIIQVEPQLMLTYGGAPMPPMGYVPPPNPYVQPQYVAQPPHPGAPGPFM